MKSALKLTFLSILGAVLIGLLPIFVWAQVKTKSPGRAPGPEMKMKQSQVPTFDIYQTKIVNGKKETFRLKNIPRLNIGEEPRLESSDLADLKLPPAKKLNLKPVEERPLVPEVFINTATMNLPEIPKDAKEVKAIDPTFNAPFVSPPPVVELTTVKEVKPEVRELAEMNPSQMKLLQALIFLEIQKEYGLAIGLFAELLNDQDPKIKTESTYHLALTTHAVGLYSEYKYQMMKVLASEDKEWQKRAVMSLASKAEPGDKALVRQLDPILEKLGIAPEKSDQYQLNRAKYYLDKDDLGRAMAAVDEILLDSPLYTQALFLKGVLLYKSGQLQEAIGIQQQVLNRYEQIPGSEDMRSITALTLARLHFQAGQLQEAFNVYLKVDKKHPDWMQAMIEQAWTQILSQDYEGAAGNMFSLHTDFFKKAFHPESYIVRTVGYLNLCQYGDGAKAVYDLKRRYEPVKAQLTTFEAQGASEEYFYDTVKAWAKNPVQPVVNGLPREFIFQLTRHPNFIQRQQNINSLEDQVVKINRLALDIIKKERVTIAKVNDARAKIAEYKKRAEKASPEEKNRIREEASYQAKRVLNFQIQGHIAKKARTAIRDLRKAGLQRLEIEEIDMRKLAGSALKEKFNAMKTRLVASLDQTDVLQYELYSGAGEHIRYQMAGGEISEKERPELKVEPGKALKWDFKGEIWEDELGHYRSSLKNVCAPEDTTVQ
ncbi:MAG: tetratricopeptide repeat protein [Pseudobdellovibrionaceae bacterium]